MPGSEVPLTSSARPAPLSVTPVEGDGRIVLLGAEDHPPYERPPLSKAYLAGAADRDTVFVHPAGWYADRQTRGHPTVTFRG